MLPLRDRLPSRRTPVVTYAIIAINVLAYVWERALTSVGYPAHAFVTEWGLVPARFIEAPLQDLFTVLSSMFLHDPSGLPLHLGGNMLFLWIFGDNVEDAMGRVNYAIFYLLSGLAAAFAQLVIDPASPIPMIGASGAISGVLAAYGSLYPRSPVLVVNPFFPAWFIFGVFIELPAWVIIIEYFIMNLLNGLGSLSAQGGGVAFFAHLGGFVAGLILCRFFMAGRLLRPHDRWGGWRPPPRTRPPPPPPPPPYSPYGGGRQRGPWEW
jgi:membrane associated rhomboid family serine protease